MNDLEKLLENYNLHYDVIKKYLNSTDENILFKIINNITRFDDKTKMKVCENIIKNTDSENIINNACREISVFVPFDYEYYKKILKMIISKGIEGTWVSEFKKDILENSPLVMQEVFQDFSLNMPVDIDYDLCILQSFLEDYNNYSINLNAVNLTKEQSLIICKRLNYILSIEINSILKLYFHFDNLFKFTQDELNSFLKKFFFNYPSICKQFIERNNSDDSIFIDYLKHEANKYNSDNELKNNLTIFKPNCQRLYEYQKYQFIQSKEMIDKARRMSILSNFCKSNTILYGNRYGMTVKHKDGEEVSIGNMHEFSYSYTLPLEYTIDPIEYIDKFNEILSLSKEKV